MRHDAARLVDIVEATLSLISTVIKRDQITLQVEVPADLPQVNCRSQQIRQVLMNLVTNARDALNEKYPGFDKDKLIRLTAALVERQGRKFIRTTVEDHGCGIPEIEMARIFEPFYTTKPKEIGTGLGLSISYGIVQDHRGKLWLENRQGGGSLFHMDLPVNDE